MTPPLFFHKQWLSGSPLGQSMKNYYYHLGWVTVFLRHPKYWIRITNSRDILRFKRTLKHGPTSFKVQKAWRWHYFLHKKWLCGSPLSPAWKITTISLNWVTAFRRHPKCWSWHSGEQKGFLVWYNICTCRAARGLKPVKNSGGVAFLDLKTGISLVFIIRG